MLLGTCKAICVSRHGGYGMQGIHDALHNHMHCALECTSQQGKTLDMYHRGCVRQSPPCWCSLGGGVLRRTCAAYQARASCSAAAPTWSGWLQTCVATSQPTSRGTDHAWFESLKDQGRWGICFVNGTAAKCIGRKQINREEQ